MAEPYVGQIMFSAFTFAPNGYALCDGALLNFSQNTALYSLIGVTYGGQTNVNFRLPDLRGRVVVGQGAPASGGPTYRTGDYGGQEAVTLTADQLPMHSHDVNASRNAGTVALVGNIPAAAAPAKAGGLVSKLYAPHSETSRVALSSHTVSDVGAGQAHPNMQSFLVACAAIALSGDYPPRPS